MDYKSSKRPGNILSAFNSDCEVEISDKFINLKKQLVIEMGGEAKLNDAWNRLLKDFENEAKQINELGSASVPSIEFKEVLENVGKFPDDFATQVRKRGCVLIKNVVGVDEALGYKEEIKKYIQNHPGQIAGFPEENPQVWELYWSKSQLAARSHPNFFKVTGAVNQLWSADENTPIDFSTNIAYCDRLRIREPGDTSFTLNEHIDGGSVERWEDPEYRKCYSQILQGEWEKHDAFDATHRLFAKMDLYNCSGGCSMFRTFQGWMSLSYVKPGGGTLRLCPLIKLSTAYLIMRPLLKDYINEKDMGGAMPGAQQHIHPNLHPHIVSSVVSIPEVGPGDCVFWHCDCVHAVEPLCSSEGDSSVLYIPATPLCPKNVDYLMKQRHAFVNGLTPQDFPLNNCEQSFSDRGTLRDLSKLGKKVMGFEKFEIEDDEGVNAKMAKELANKTLQNF